MDNEKLVERIDRTNNSWNTLPPIIEAAYDTLLEEDTFWSPETHNTFSLPVWWQRLADTQEKQ